MKCRFKGQFRVRVRHPRPWFDSAPGHQETPKPPSGGFFICGLAGLGAISLGYPHQELSFKRTNQLSIPALVNVV